MSAKPEKIAIVTGANSGIGFDTTAGMAEAGYHVVMACRSQHKAETAKTSLMDRLPQASLDVVLVDLGDFVSVRAFADEFRARFGRLDILINNAGILLNSAKSDANGIELQFVTNHLGHFLLTGLLMDLMPDDPASRIIALSSIAHKNAQIDFRDLSCGRDGLKAYGQSKLACLLLPTNWIADCGQQGARSKPLRCTPAALIPGFSTR